jgi:hypothetical protein
MDVRKVWRAQVIDQYIWDRRVVELPGKPARLRVVLEVLAEEFEPGQEYSEAMVNLMLGRWHPDSALLRRHLIDSGLLERTDRVYRRASEKDTPIA